MRKKDKKFQLRLDEMERKALHRLADLKELSAGAWLRKYIRSQAKENGIKIGGPK